MGSRGFFFLFENLTMTKVYQFRGFKRCEILFAPEQPRDRQDDVGFDGPIWSELIDDIFLVFFEFRRTLARQQPYCRISPVLEGVASF
jgi:hypothetical protein